jgi:hypothetical protein
MGIGEVGLDMEGAEWAGGGGGTFRGGRGGVWFDVGVEWRDLARLRKGLWVAGLIELGVVPAAAGRCNGLVLSLGMKGEEAMLLFGWLWNGFVSELLFDVRRGTGCDCNCCGCDGVVGSGLLVGEPGRVGVEG